MIINWWPSISVFLQAVQESLSSTTARKCETVPPGSEMSSGYIVRLLTQKVINLLFLISNMCSFMRRNQARQSHGSPRYQGLFSAVKGKSAGDPPACICP